MPAFFRATLPEFLATSDSELLGKLSLAHAEHFQTQLADATTTWFADIRRLQVSLDELLALHPSAALWSVLLEFQIPRKKARIDVVLLAGPLIILLEQKSSATGREGERQLEGYALLLHYFHKPSDRRRIIPLLVSPAAAETPLREPQLALTDTAAYWIDPVRRISWLKLAKTLRRYDAQSQPGALIDPLAWDEGDYFPVPSIIEAARTLQAGAGSIREIAHSRAARHDLDQLTGVIKQCVDQAQTTSQFVICFVTGVPGSGKTLVGLNLAFSSRAEGSTLSFMSGNGPLVSVLQALFRDYKQRIEKMPAAEAKTQSEALVEDVHLFAKEYTRTRQTGLGDTGQALEPLVPANQVVIFDEAQRAWNYEQSYRKFGRETSEPEMFLRIMERRPDWAVIVALVGGGQEINDGEAGIAEWGRALANPDRKRWRIIASPEVIEGGDAVAGGRLLSDPVAAGLQVDADERLHLTVSVRSLKAESYSRWVNAVIEGDAQAANALDTGGFPVYLTRDLTALRKALKAQLLGDSRGGLVGSSKAARLRAEGLEPDSDFHASYAWDRWYLAPPSDVRASSQLEVYASEFEIQGLELDWIGLCWGGDLIWSEMNSRWMARKFRNAGASGWTNLKQAAQQEYRRNAYRVLLTRARQGLIIFVPTGDANDHTRNVRELDETTAFLLACGVKPLPGEIGVLGTATQQSHLPVTSLFAD